MRIAGLVGRTEQALAEADIALGLGYHAGMVSLAAFAGASEDERLEHCARLARHIPLVGFYLQPAVGGVTLGPTLLAAEWRRSTTWWRSRSRPFNRYRTLDVVRGVVEAGAEERVTLYTGNDDHILLDLVTPYRLMRGGEAVTVRIKGRLLGHWSVWVKRAVGAARPRPRGGRRGRDRAPTSWRSTPRSPTATPPSSTSPTTFGAASPAATRCSAARG